MNRNAWNRRHTVYGLLIVGIGLGAVLLLTGAVAAPSTEGLILQVACHPGTAAPGNGNEAYVLVSIYNAAGPVRGLSSGNLSVSVVAGPTGAPPLKKGSVLEPVSGVYKIGLAPELSSQRWVGGTYVVSVALTSSNGSGVVVGELIVGG